MVRALSWGLALLAFAATQAAGSAYAQTTLQDIRARGFVVCGVASPPAGNAARTGAGLGVDGEVCRAVASAVFGAPNKVRFRQLPDLDAFAAEPTVDIVAHGLTWTLSRSMLPNARFGPIVLHDGQAFLVRKADAIPDAKALGGREVCVHDGGEAALNLAAYARAANMDVKVVVAEDLAASEQQFLMSECAALSADLTELSAVLGRINGAGQYDVLPDVISEEPIAPLVRGDEQFFQVVNWTVFALIEAEALGLKSATVSSHMADEGMRMDRLLHPSAQGSSDLGLGRAWTADVVRGVGAYDEVFARQLGPLLRTRAGRGANLPWEAGGVLYAPPFR